MDCTNVFSVLAVPLPVLRIGGTVKSMYLPFRNWANEAWTSGIDASLSMDGGFKRPSNSWTKGTITKLSGPLQMSYVRSLLYRELTVVFWTALVPAPRD